MALAEIQEKFGGRWKLDRKENMDEYLKEIGVNYLMRKMMVNLSPEEDFNVEGDEIVIKLKAGPMTKESRFKLNEEYEEDRMGTKMKCYYTYEDGKLKIESKPVDKPEMKVQHITREIIGDETVITVVVGDGDLTCTRYFKRL